MNKYFFLVMVLSTALICFEAIAKPGYFRAPAIHDDTLVFTAEGDLWLADISSGQAKSSVAQRLTTHPAEEIDASFSPDGQWIAFTADYEGATEVYVIPRTGGVAKRLSYENASVSVHGLNPGDQPPIEWPLHLIPIDIAITYLGHHRGKP